MECDRHQMLLRVERKMCYFYGYYMLRLPKWMRMPLSVLMFAFNVNHGKKTKRIHNVYARKDVEKRRQKAFKFMTELKVTLNIVNREKKKNFKQKWEIFFLDENQTRYFTAHFFRHGNKQNVSIVSRVQ